MKNENTIFASFATWNKNSESCLLEFDEKAVTVWQEKI